MFINKKIGAFAGVIIILFFVAVYFFYTKNTWQTDMLLGRVTNSVLPPAYIDTSYVPEGANDGYKLAINAISQTCTNNLVLIEAIKLDNLGVFRYQFHSDACGDFHIDYNYLKKQTSGQIIASGLTNSFAIDVRRWKITPDQAQTIATKSYTGTGTMQSLDLANPGILQYEITFREKSGSVTRLIIDASNGRVLTQDNYFLQQ